MRTVSDDRLVRMMQKGDQDAFAELVQRHQDAVYSLCYRMTGNPAEAEDLTQEAFLRCLRSLGGFRRGGRLRPWLNKIASNVCIDALRRRRDPPLPLDDLLEYDERLQGDGRDGLPEPAYLNLEARLGLQQALMQLPADYRVVLVLRYLQDLSYREVAKTLDVPLTTVETRIYRAKRLLGRLLAPEAEGLKEEA